MSPYDVPFALAGLIAVAASFLAWAVWVARDVAQARRAARRTPGTRSREQVAPLPACHVTGCPVPGYVPCYRYGNGGRLEVIDVCHGHADEGSTYGWWMRQRGWREVAS